MITKKQFCHSMATIIKFQNEQRKIDDFINNILCKQSVASVCIFGGELIEEITTLLASNFKNISGAKDDIEWFLYEVLPNKEKGGIVIASGITLTINTTEDLYDFLVNYANN